MARKKTKNKSKGTELDVFKDRAGRANLAIFEVLAKTSPQNIKQILKQIARYEGLEETYYASLTKRLNRLCEDGFLKETKQATGQKSYELQMKAYLAMFLNEYSMQIILSQATDIQAAHILLTLLNVALQEKT
ncbi:hypothetical protein G4O51_03215 [Candidatus Bathyarchaeota archaeon A05DMB-2]|nr:hypothetical protein [Candidatus Bathyarchaeota archaeon A05DMB-2]